MWREEVTIDDVTEKVVGGGTPPRNNAENWNGPMPWATVKDFSNSYYFLNDTQEYITDDGLRNSAANLIPAGIPIVVTRMAVGSCKVSAMPVSINQDLKALFPDENEIISNYLAWSIIFRKDDLDKVAIGSTVKGISIKDLKKLKIFRPIPDDQSHICEILFSIDNTIEKTEELIAKYEQIKQGMMYDLFTRGVDENGKLRPSYQDAPELYQDTEIGFIPKDWDISSLDEISSIRRGASPRPIDDPAYFAETGRGWIRISDVTHTYKYLTQTTQYLSDLGASLSVPVNPGDLIMSICATIGRPVLLAMEACIHDGFVLFGGIDEEEIDKEYLFYFLLKNEQEISKNKQIGTQGNLNTDIVKSIVFPKPSKEEQTIVAQRLRAIDTLIQVEQKTLAKLIKQKAGLMQDLLTGKVSVNIEQRDAA